MLKIKIFNLLKRSTNHNQPLKIYYLSPEKQPKMNADFLLIIGAFEALFLGVLVLAKGKKQTSDYLLSGILLLNGLTIFFSWIEIFNSKNGYPYPALINSSTPLILLHGPLLWMYVKSLTTENFHLRLKHLLHIIPFVIVFTMLNLDNFTKTEQERILFHSEQIFKQHWSYPVIITAILLSIQTYLWHGIFHIRKYTKKVKSYFSSLDHFNLKWLRFLLYTAMIFYGIISITYIFDYFLQMLPYQFLQLTGFIIATVFILLLGFFGLRQGNIFTSLNIKELPDQQHSFRPIIPLESAEENFVKKILQHMKEQKPYLAPDLTLLELSNQLSVNPEYLSGILNGRLNSNFFDFINYYRIETFKEFCRDATKKNLTLLGIAYECGFNSKATFNRVFKKRLGITPGEYAKKVSKK